MTSRDWYAQPEHEVAELQNDDDGRGVIMLAAREVADGWEYAIVHWRYRLPHLVLLLRNGRPIEWERDGVRIVARGVDDGLTS